MESPTSGLSDAILEQAANCLGKTAKLGTRTAELLHVAAALELGAELLYSSTDSRGSLPIRWSEAERGWPALKDFLCPSSGFPQSKGCGRSHGRGLCAKSEPETASYSLVK